MGVDRLLRYLEAVCAASCCFADRDDFSSGVSMDSPLALKMAIIVDLALHSERGCHPYGFIF